MLSEKYATHRRAREYLAPNQLLAVVDRSKNHEVDRFVEPEAAEFDLGIDDEGVWLIARGSEKRKTADGLLIPWSDMAFLKHVGEKSYVHLYGFEPFEPVFPKVIGDEIESRVRRL